MAVDEVGGVGSANDASLWKVSDHYQREDDTCVLAQRFVGFDDDRRARARCAAAAVNNETRPQLASNTASSQPSLRWLLLQRQQQQSCT